MKVAVLAVTEEDDAGLFESVHVTPSFFGSPRTVAASATTSPAPTIVDPSNRMVTGAEGAPQPTKEPPSERAVATVLNTRGGKWPVKDGMPEEPVIRTISHKALWIVRNTRRRDNTDNYRLTVVARIDQQRTRAGTDARPPCVTKSHWPNLRCGCDVSNVDCLAVPVVRSGNLHLLTCEGFRL